MDTTLNIANITPDTTAMAGRQQPAVEDRRDKTVLNDNHGQGNQDDSDSESSFAGVLQSESGPAPAKESGKSNQDSSDEARTSAESDREETADSAASGTITESPREATQGLILQAMETDESARPINEGTTRLATDRQADLASTRTDSRPGPVPGDALQQSVAAPKKESGQSTPEADTGQAQEQQSEFTRTLVRSTEDQGKQSTNSESFTAAGKTLPPPGKGLPAGFFMNSGNDQKAFARMGENLTRATDPINLDEQFVARMNPAGKMEIETGGDKLLRSILTAQTAAAGSDSSFSGNLASSSQPASQNPDTSAVLNQFTLAGVGERGLQAPRLAGPTTVEAPLGFNITAEAGSADFNNQLSSRIRWMGNVNLSSAELKLHPAELGSVEVRISTEDDQTRVSFITSNANAKEIIESSLPRLRELLGDSGLQLEQGDVTHREQSGDDKQQTVAGGTAGDAEEVSDSETRSIHIKRESRGQIDHYV